MADATLNRYGQLAMRTRALLEALEIEDGDQAAEPVLAAAIDLLEQAERKLSLYVSAMPSAGSTPPSRAELQDLWIDAGRLLPDPAASPPQSPATDI